MTGQDPETLQYFAYIAIVVGIAELIYGLVQRRSTDRTAQGVSLIMTWGSIGWFVAAALCYFGNMYHWILIPSFAAVLGASGIGYFFYFRLLKSGGTAGNIVS
jgi:uncharacterized membrane protein HdeD (DUF308 family)